MKWSVALMVVLARILAACAAPTPEVIEKDVIVDQHEPSRHH